MKKELIKLGALCLLMTVLIVVMLKTPGSEAPGEYIAAGSEEERAALLIMGGAEDFRLISAQDIIIPQKDDGVYGKYLALQALQGLPLEYLGGEKAILYTYEAPGFRSSNNVRIELMVCKDRLAAAGVYEYLCGTQYTALFQQNIPKSD